MKPGKKTTVLKKSYVKPTHKPTAGFSATGPWPLLWQAWLSQAAGTHLDRWLSANLARLVPAPGAHAALVARLQKAVAYQQLICALAHQFETGQSRIDWRRWDANWSPAQVSRLSVAQVEQWLDLRLNPEPSGAAPELARKIALVQSFRAEVDSNPAIFALWHGLRPGWMDAINARAQLSGWGAEQVQAFAVAQALPPPLWLRLQSDMAPEQARASLEQDGVLVEQTAHGLCAHGGRPIRHSQLFKAGAIEIQDLASQALAATVAAAPGQKVWDVCAGAGGKTQAIASRMNNKGMLLATDIHERKLQELKRRAKRAEMFNIRSFVWAAEAPLVLPKEVAQQQGFDWVLIDAPCSASGTWRRNPEARWRYSPQDTSELVALQWKILTQAIPAVRTGGHLVYTTCSWDERENERQIRALLAQHAGFTLVSESMLGCPLLDADTMYVAVLRKQS